MVYGIKYVVYGIKYVVYCIKCVVYGIKYFDVWYQLCGCIVTSIWVYGIKSHTGYRHGGCNVGVILLRFEKVSMYSW